MSLTGTKALVLVLIGVIKLVSGLAPLFITKIFRKKSEILLQKFIGEFNPNIQYFHPKLHQGGEHA